MQSFSSFLNNFNPDPSKAGKTLLVLNALGMVFAAISNTFAAGTDKNTSKEDKKFLVPAGAATGVANIALYYGMTTKIIDKLGGKDITKNGTTTHIRGLADDIIDTMKQDGSFDVQLKNFVNNQISKAEKGGLFGLGKKSSEYIESMKTSLLKNGLPSDYAASKFAGQIKSGMGVLGAFIGAVVGCAIFTPIIRDISAYFVQKVREKKNPSLQDQPYRPYFDPSHLKVDYKGKKQPLSMKAYMAFTNSGNMKI